MTKTAKPRKTVTVSVITRTVVSDDVARMRANEKAMQESYHSLSQHLRMHRGCQDEALAPSHGGILHKMFRQGEGLLTKQQLYGWQFFWDDLRKEHEASNGMVSSMGGSDGGNYSSRELQKARPGPSTRLTAAGERARSAWNSLRKHERGLLEQLIRDAFRTEGHKEIHAHTAEYLGGILSGYRDNRQKIAAANSAIQRLLSSLAEFYGVEPFAK